MWRFLVFALLLMSAVHAEQVILFGDNETALFTDFHLLGVENILLIDLLSPSDGTVVDRDGVDPTDPEQVSVVLGVPSYVPDGTPIQLRGNLTLPSGIAQTTNVVLGTNSTTNRETIVYLDPNSSVYAGNWTLFGYTLASSVNSTHVLTTKGSLAVAFSDSNTDPNSTYAINQSILFTANVTSGGAETRTNLSNVYALAVDSIMNNASAASTVSMAYLNPVWSVLHNAINLYGVGPRTVSANATGGFWYDAGDEREVNITSFMNVTANVLNPSVTGLNTTVTATCTVQDQFSGYGVFGANVTAYRNATYIGYNTTNSSGQTDFSFVTDSYGAIPVTCNITTDLSIFYSAGDAPELNSTLTVTSMPPSFVIDVTDDSNSVGPTNESSNVTFTANATDTEGEQWRLIICTGSEGISAAVCNDTLVCISGFVNSGTIATCQHNTSGESAQTYDWWAYACDISNACSGYNNTTSPYEVNHGPTVSPSLNNYAPDVTDTITCSAGSSDPDSGDVVNNVYAWYRQNEGAGAYSVVVGETSNQLSSPDFDSNDNILCQVTPTDNHGLLGNASNSSIATGQNGTLSADATFNDTTILRTHNATIDVSCTLTTGDSEAVTLTVQDNRTGVFAESSTAPAAVYVNVSSFSLGQVASQTVTRTVLVRTQTAGDYAFRAQCTVNDATPTVANSSSQTLQVALDTTPPVISGIASNPTGTSATIIWSTDEIADSTVDYGPSTALGSTVQNPSFVTSHSLGLVSLSYSTTYYFNITSCNIDNYCATTGPNSFTTGNSEDVANPVTGGACTAVIVERNSDATGDNIGEGDVVEFYCELPHRVYERQELGVTIINKDKQTQKAIETPDLIYGQRVVLYP